MPIAYRLDKISGLTLVVWHGAVTTNDFAAHVEKLASDPDWPPGTRHLGDLTTATTIPEVATPEIVARFRAASTWPTIRYALVAREGWEHAVAFQQATDDLGSASMVVFNEFTGACGWLDIDTAAARAGINELRSQLRATPN